MCLYYYISDHNAIRTGVKSRLMYGFITNYKIHAFSLHLY